MPEEAVLTATAPSAGADGAESTSSIAESPTAIEETQATPEGQETAEQQPAETSTEQPTTEQATEDGRVIPKWIRNMQKSDPQGYAQAKSDFFALRSFRSVFPSVKDAQQAKEQLEFVGGPEGLSEIQSEHGEFKTVAQQFFDGDPAFVDDLANEDPVAFGAHVPHTLDKFMEVDRTGYNREMAKRISGEHESAQLRPRLEAIYQAVKDGNSQEALDGLNAIAGWHDKLEEIGKQEDDPRFTKLREELTNQRKEGAERTKTEVLTDYRTTSAKQIESRASSLLDSYLPGKKLSAEDRSQLMQNVLYAANNEVLRDATFQKQLDLQRERAVSTRNTSAAVRFAVARFEQAMKAAVERQARLMGVSAKPAVAPKPGETNGSRTPVGKPVDGFAYITSPPSDKEINRFETNRDMVLKQRAVLKDGRKVTWAKSQ